MNNLIVYKDNELVEASYRLNLIEQRLMLYCISKVNPDHPERTQTIVVDDFLDQFPDIKPNNAYKQIKTAIDSLYERSIRVSDTQKVKEFRWISAKEYYSDCGTASISFSLEVMPYLFQLEKQFTKYQLRNISGFKRVYSIRLYELLTQYKNLGKRVLELSEIRSALQLQDKFIIWADFKRYVIDPSVKEINEKSDLTIEYKPIRLGRAVNSIDFLILTDEKIEKAERLQTLKQFKKMLKGQ